MNKYLAFPILSLATLLAWGPRSELRAQEATPGIYEVSIPKSRIEKPAVSSSTEKPRTNELSVGASSWSPDHFSISSQVAGAGNLSRQSLPSFYVNELTSAALLDGASWIFGLSWLEMQRTADLGGGFLASQNVELFSLRVGVQYSPSAWDLWTVKPYLAAALLPTVALSGRSAFDSGSSSVGLPLEGAIGARFMLTGLGLNGISLDLGAVGTAGTIKGSSLSGVGVQGGLRFVL